MTVTNDVNRVKYFAVGGPSAPALDTVFSFSKNSDIEVFLTLEEFGTQYPLTQDSEYTISGGGGSGNQSSSTGTVTPVDPNDFVSGTSWEIRRVLPIEQTEFDIDEGASIAALSINSAFDRLAMQAQQLDDFTLLAEASSDGSSKLTLNVAGNGGTQWSDTYDSVLIEFLGVYPVLPDKFIRILALPLDTGTQKAILRTTRTAIGGSQVTTVQSPATWAISPNLFVINNLASSLNGSLTCHATGGGAFPHELHGYGHFQYKNQGSGTLAQVMIFCHASGVQPVNGFQIDGYDADLISSNVVGQARVWGLPQLSSADLFG